MSQAEIVREAPSADDLRDIDQELIDEMFFAIIRWSFPHRIQTCPVAPTESGRALPVRRRSSESPAAPPTLPLARVRSPPAT